jgi:hypothetical protein
MKILFTAAAAAAPHLSPRCPRASSSSLSWTLPQPAGGRDGPPRTQCTMSGRPRRPAAAAAAPPDPATNSTPLRGATAAAGAPALRCAAFSCRAVAAAAPQAVGDHRLRQQCLISRRTRLCQPSSAPAPATPCSIYRLLLLLTTAAEEKRRQNGGSCRRRVRADSPGSGGLRHAVCGRWIRRTACPPARSCVSRPCASLGPGALT